MKRINEIRQELKEMAEQEATRLYRLARRAEKKGCKQELVTEIRDEAHWLHTTAQAYPERIVHWQFEYLFKYAFR